MAQIICEILITSMPQLFLVSEWINPASHAGSKLSTKKKAGATQATAARTDISPHAQRQAQEANRSVLDSPEIAKLVRRLRLQTTDGTLLLGDAVMVLSTHFASEKLPQSDLLTLSFTAAAIWVGCAYTKGDYDLTKSYPGDGWLAAQPGYSVLVGIRESAFAWLRFVPCVSTAFASLVIHGALDADPLMITAEGCKVPPEVEVLVALVLMVPCWRGAYYAMRDGLL